MLTKIRFKKDTKMFLKKNQSFKTILLEPSIPTPNRHCHHLLLGLFRHLPPLHVLALPLLLI